MSLTRGDVEKTALLARLELTEAELDAMTSQLGTILAYVEQLGRLNTDGVAPMAHAVEVTNVFAADEVRESLPREAALSNAPRQDGEFYLVPAVLGE
jgi:aspartyl-tRNA(Asn)/glutamyl-tRNA(Gln) amidotransferase subunit C